MDKLRAQRVRCHIVGMNETSHMRVGERVGDRFELKALVCSHGLGWSFTAFDHEGRNDVSIILVDPARAYTSAWISFARLVTAVSDVQGLVLPQFVASPARDSPYCYTEIPAGRGLDRILALASPLPWQRVMLLGERLLEVLINAHSATGVAHRALTPSRCIVMANDEVLIADYGVAELECEVGIARDTTYRAPEQIDASGDPRCDVYSLAAILFEVICGKRPEPRLPAHLRLHVPVPFNVDMMLARALAWDPGQRYHDLTEMRAAVRELLGLPAVVHPQPAKKALPKAKSPAPGVMAPRPIASQHGATPRGGASLGQPEASPHRQEVGDSLLAEVTLVLGTDGAAQVGPAKPPASFTRPAPVSDPNPPRFAVGPGLAASKLTRPAVHSAPGPLEDRTEALPLPEQRVLKDRTPLADRTEALPRLDRTEALPRLDRTEALPRLDRTEALPAIARGPAPGVRLELEPRHPASAVVAPINAGLPAERLLRDARAPSSEPARGSLAPVFVPDDVTEAWVRPPRTDIAEAVPPFSSEGGPGAPSHVPSDLDATRTWTKSTHRNPAVDRRLPVPGQPLPASVQVPSQLVPSPTHPPLPITPAGAPSQRRALIIAVVLLITSIILGLFVAAAM